MKCARTKLKPAAALAARSPSSGCGSASLAKSAWLNNYPEVTEPIYSTEFTSRGAEAQRRLIECEAFRWGDSR